MWGQNWKQGGTVTRIAPITLVSIDATPSGTRIAVGFER